jgi:lysophospholipase L1-like esterase
MKFKNEILLLLISSSITIMLSVLLGEIYIFFKNKSNWATKGAEHDSELGWVLTSNNSFKTNGRISTINSMGFRSPEIDLNQRHIVILGDSVAFGSGIGDKETLSYQLAKELKEFQVLNFSVPGYSVDQYYLTLKKHINKTNPALVVVVIFTGNDMQETRKDNLFGIGKPWFEISGKNIKVVNKSLPRYSCTNFLSRSWAIKILRLENLAREICENNEYDGINAIMQMEKILLKINKLVSSQNASLLFILSPTIYDYYQVGLNCSSEKNLDDCLTMRKSMQNLLLTQVKNTRNKNAKVSFKIVDGLKVFRDMSRVLQNIFKNLNLPHLDMINLNIKLRRDVIDDYNGADPFHLSPTGNRHLAELIKTSIKVEGEQISIKQNLRKSIISNQ